jgi:hypothetical protein
MSAAGTALRHAGGLSFLSFHVNQYVIDRLIDWDRVPAPPMFQLTFPQPAKPNQGRRGGAMKVTMQWLRERFPT